MEIKLFEIRDRATFIPAIGLQFRGGNSWLLRRAGFGTFSHYVFMIRLTDCKCRLWPHDWNDNTMRDAHEHVFQNWNNMHFENVIDVEFVRGESDAPKESERKYED